MILQDGVVVCASGKGFRFYLSLIGVGPKPSRRSFWLAFWVESAHLTLKSVTLQRRGGGVVTLDSVPKGAYVLEYECSAVYGQRERARHEEEYENNGEGCYILDVLMKDGVFGCYQVFPVVWPFIESCVQVCSNTFTTHTSTCGG